MESLALQWLKKRLGYSLIELAVGIAILSILAIVAYPALSTILQNYRTSTAADNLYYWLQYARTEAVKRNTNVYVSFVTGDSWCYGVNLTSACTCTTAGSCGLGTVSASQSQRITLSTSGLTSNSIYFEGTHAAANASGSITFTTYGKSQLVTISIGRLGGIQLCSTGISGYTAC